jgi:dipeptidase
MTMLKHFMLRVWGARSRSSVGREARVLPIVLVALVASANPAWASYCVYVGKNLTIDGSVFLGGYGDEPSSHWLQIVPTRAFPSGAMIWVGVTQRANFPGVLSEIPQVARTAKYITMNYSEYSGFPAPLTNGGLNEHGVAARDVWSPSRRELQEMTPNPQTGGPNYSDLARLVMERAHTSREAVEIIGALIAEHGFSTYGGNSHLFADADEGWVLINFAGGQGLWAAERLGSDDVRVSRPGYIGDFPIDFENNPDYMASPNFVSFAVEQGWYDLDSGEPFNVNKVYGDGQMRHPAVVLIEERMKALAGKVGLTDMIAAVRTTEVTRDSAGYGQVAHLRKGVHQELGVLWVAATTSVTAPFIPFYIGTTDVPTQLKRHRYLTGGEATQYMVDEEERGIESTRFALRTYKRLLYLVQEHQEKFLPEVTEALEAFEARLIERQETVEQTALKLFEAGEPQLARRYLTYYSGTEALNGWRLGEALANSIEARTEALYGIRQ